MLVATLLIGLGLGLLTVSADRFVVSAVRLAEAWGVSKILIGALVVGMGTSAPEFIVSVVSGGRSMDLAIGNIVGSNIANLSLVLGVGTLIAVVANPRRLLRREGFLMVGGLLMFTGALADGGLTRLDGLVLAAGMVGAAYLLVRWSAASPNDLELDEFEGGPIRVGREIAIALLTLSAMLLGANWLADGALRMAAELGVSEGFIGLTVVAIGTSLPELATVVASARRAEMELVVGNLLGSNLFNSLAVAAGVALLRPGQTSSSFAVSLAVMVGIALLAGALSLTRDRLDTREGVALLVVYGGYLAYSAL